MFLVETGGDKQLPEAISTYQEARGQAARRQEQKGLAAGTCSTILQMFHGRRHPSQCLQSSNTLLHIATFLFIRLSNNALCNAPSSINPHLQCFHLAVVNNGAMVVRWQYLFIY